MIFLYPMPARSGLDEFTVLDKIEEWIIERKIDSETQKQYCRASIPNFYSWFGDRIRLNPNGETIIPTEFIQSPYPKTTVLNKVREALKLCRSSLIYQSQY